ncbi:hypothetical protein NHX12_003554 [Muraenolepis orangiensis]|uniref:Replication stress response regulator SDE2 n=1 Tax=Muraenolepis orangiensis TaxID=630683 RepID=A0A9Q0DWT2_9TELE|nr:hypothetical protein NHX12_003554 [Muraenolepis orangiensis]
MLRALGAQIEKTTNREACRDLSGRRLRDVNHEKEMAEWLKKQAEVDGQKDQRRVERLQRKLMEPKHQFTDTEYQQQSHQLSERLEDSVLKGMQASASGVVSAEAGPSTKRANKQPGPVPRKKKRFWTGVEDLDLPSAEPFCFNKPKPLIRKHQDPQQMYLMDRRKTAQMFPKKTREMDSQKTEKTDQMDSQKTEKTDQMDSQKTDQMDSQQTEKTDQMDSQQTEKTDQMDSQKTDQMDSQQTEKTVQMDSQQTEKTDQMDSQKTDQMDSQQTEKTDQMDSQQTEKTDQMDSQQTEKTDQMDSQQTEKTDQMDSQQTEKTDQMDSQLTEKTDQMDSQQTEKTDQMDSQKTDQMDSQLTKKTDQVDPEQTEKADQVDPQQTKKTDPQPTTPEQVLELLDSAGSPEDLEVIGLDRLKEELQTRGLKCGGTLKERATRLYSVRGLSPEQIDPLLLAKTGSKGRKRK